MGNLINSLPQILEKSASLFGVFALVAIVLASVVFLLFGKADPKQKERIFVYMTLFFLALTFSALAAGTLSGFKDGGEAVTTQIEQDPSSIDPSLVSLSPDAIQILEKYLNAQGEAVTPQSKVQVLEEALEAYVSPTSETAPSPRPIVDPSPPLQTIEAEQTARDKGVTFDLLQCGKESQNTICYFRITRTTDGICAIDRRAVRAIDLSGNEHFSEAVQMGDEEGSNVSTNFIRDIPIRASFTFGDDLQTVNNLAAVEIGTGYNDACGHFVFRDVAVK